MSMYSIYHYDGKEKIYNKEIDCSQMKNEEEIIDFVRTLRKEKGLEFMWERNREIRVMQKDGSTKVYNSVKEEFMGEFTLWDKIISYILYRPWNKLSNLWYCIKWGFQRMFRGYDDRMYWNLDYKILEIFKKVLPKFIETLHGYPISYSLKAKDLVKDKFEKEECENKVGEIAFALWKSDLEEFLNRLNLLEYYDFNGLEFENEYENIDKIKYPIPYYEFSKEVNYDKLHCLQKENRDKIFEFLKENFVNLWD